MWSGDILHFYLWHLPAKDRIIMENDGRDDDNNVCCISAMKFALDTAC